MSSELCRHGVSGALRSIPYDERQLIPREPVEKIVLGKGKPFPCGGVLQLPPAIGQFLQDQKPDCANLNLLPLPECVQRHEPSREQLREDMDGGKGHTWR